MLDVSAVTQITRETLYVIIITAAPLLLTSLVVGLAISIFQTVTSIQEQTLTFVPKVLAIFAGIMLLGHWMLNNMVGLMTKLWSDFTIYVK
ncbi:MAG: flagellar biosynthesis protein FliQ [Lachnospiraceae bacterium]|nr:flagellar biosynthesis protein FliQ [Lachnospiraceae bacterium]